MERSSNCPLISKIASTSLSNNAIGCKEGNLKILPSKRNLALNP